MTAHQHTHAVGPGAELQGRPAGVVTRTIAGGIDYAVVGIATAGTYAGAAALSFLYNPVHWSWPRWAFVVLLVLGGTYMLVYLAGCWATTGKTLGGHLMGTRVVTHGDHRVRLWRSVVRALIVIAFPIGLFWSAVNRHSRSVQDLLTRTKVVYAWRTDVPRR